MNKTMKRGILSLMMSLVCVLPMLADRACPDLVTIRQNDGKQLKIRLYGDEFFHYTTDEHGYLLKQQDDGRYYYAAFEEDGRMKVSQQAYGSTQKLMHREQIPQAVKDRALEKREQQRMSVAKAGLRSAPARSSILNDPNPRQLVLLVEFSDVKFSSSTANADFTAMLNEDGYFVGGAQGSARDYFYQNSMGKFSPSFDVHGPYGISKEMKEYGGNDEYGGDKDPMSMVIEAVRAAAADGVDLSLYDSNNDAILDNVYIFYAGYSESEGGDANTIWPHSYGVYSYNEVINGIRLSTYACSSELKISSNSMSGIGTFCHEYSHVLGLWDMYDTDYAGSGGQAADWGSISLMSGGSYNNKGATPPYLCAEERAQLGWCDIPLLEEAGQYTLDPISTNQAYRINTDTENEYFVVEYRVKEKWDSYIEGEGVLIYHVDKSKNLVNGKIAEQVWLSNQVNCYPLHPCMVIIDASNKKGAGLRDAFYPSGSGNNRFSVNSAPAALSWSALPLNIGLTDIQHQNGQASFNVQEESDLVHVAGIVSLYNASPLTNAVVQLRPITETRSASGLRMSKAAKEEESYICRSNQLGQYGFYNIPKGKYLLTCQADKYMPTSYELQLDGGACKQNIVMLTEDEQYYHEDFHWYEKDLIPTRAVGTGGSPYMLGARWTAQELEHVVGELFGVSMLYISQGNPDVTAMIIVQDTIVLAEKTLENLPSGETSFSFRDDSITIEPGNEYIIAFYVEDYPEASYPVMIDDGPAVNGKGNLIYGGKDQGWMTLADASDGAIDANWMLRFVTCVNRPYVAVEDLSLAHDSMQMRVGEEYYMPTKILPSDATYRTAQWESTDPSVVTVNNTGLIVAKAPGDAYVKVSVDRGQMVDSCKLHVVPSLSSEMKVRQSQRQVMLTWERGVDDAWMLYYYKSGSTQKDSLYLDEPLACVDGLTPGSMYHFKMYAYHESQLTDSLERVVNMPKSSSAFPALYMESSYVSTQPFMLALNNLSGSYEKLVWYIDNEEQTSPIVRSLPAGEHEMKVEIHYTDNKGVETIIRQFKVKEK